MSADTEACDYPSAARCVDRQAWISAAVFWAAALFFTGYSMATLYWPFIAGGEYHFHDSLVPATEIGLFYDRLYGSDSWLWSAALNGGQPLWVSMETMPFFDPIAFVVYSAAVALEAGWWAPYHVTIFAWMFVLALGGGLCSQQLTRNRWAALLTFLLLFAGPLALAIPSQSNGFLIPFRYFPLAIYFYLRLRESVTPSILCSFVTTIAFGLASYQSVYVVVLFVGLAVSELLISGRTYMAWLGRLLQPRRAAMFLIPLAGVAPLVLWLVYLQDLVSISRTYHHGRAYFLDLPHFAGELLNAYLNLIRFDQPLSVWHGSAFLGFFVLPCLFLGFRKSALAAVRTRWRRTEPAAGAKPVAALWLWLLITVALANGLFGLSVIVRTEGELLGIRNYGFLLTGCLFLMAVLAGYGFSEIAAGRYGTRDLLTDTALFAVLAAGTLWLLEGHRDGVFALAASVATFAVIAVIWQRLAKGSGVTWAALPPVALVFLELVLSTFGHLPTLNVVTARADQPEAADLAQTRAPRLGQPGERLPTFRSFQFSGSEHWPYQFEGPAVYKVAFSYSDPYEPTPLTPLGLVGITHFFRVGAYDRLLRDTGDSEVLRAIFGVTRPILELVPRHAVDTGAEGLSLVLRDSPARPPEPLAAAADRISAIDYRGDRLRLEVEVSEEALLIYRDNMAPGWTVSVDGVRTELAVTDRVNKAVALTPGSHEVEFLYRPWAYIAAFILRAVVLIGAAFACLGLVLRGWRGQAHPDANRA